MFRESEGGTDRVTCPVKIYGSGGLTIAGMLALGMLTLYRRDGGHDF